jgi:hypothetical protein
VTKPKETVKTVKVSPYPISVTFGVPPAIHRGKIRKLTLKGFLAECENKYLTVSEKVEAQFTLPVIGMDFKEQVVVMKTYDTKTEHGVERLIEFHFTMLKDSKLIKDFLKQIGQAK